MEHPIAFGPSPCLEDSPCGACRAPVMSRNIYLGGNIFSPLAGTTPEQFRQLAGVLWNEVQTTDFPTPFLQIKSPCDFNQEFNPDLAPRANRRRRHRVDAQGRPLRRRQGIPQPPCGRASARSTIARRRARTASSMT